jgi:two-component system chemotaxis sensor kinase CheA
MGNKIDSDQELLSSFVDDVADALQGFERVVLTLHASDSHDPLQELLRTAHNIKGASMCIGLEAFGEFVHSVEDVIQCTINGHLSCNDEIVQTLLAAQRCMMLWARALVSDPTNIPPAEGILTQLKALSAKKFVKSVEDVEAVPLRASLDSKDELEALFEEHHKKYLAERAVAEVDSDSDAPSAVQDDVEPYVEPKTVQRVGDRTPSPRFKGEHSSKDKQSRSHETVRISAKKLDELIQLISELSIHQGIIQEARKNDDLSSKSADHALQLSSKLVKDVHAKALELRMQPLSGLMQKLEKTALEIAAMQGKKVKVIVEGADVQLDKSVIEKVSDPLLHVIRNAVDHGVEAPSRREAVGKPAEAVVKISAVQDAVGVSICVRDDGRGMDENVIFSAAVRKGLVREDEDLTIDEIRRLIFVQGLSTATKLTEISGRGVGMDIVMKTVQQLRGRIDLDSEVGKGTSITVVLPTSLSIVDALVVKVRDSRYAVAMQELTEIIDLGRYPIETTGQGGFMISLRGEVIPVETLADYMPTHDVRHVTDLIMEARGGKGCPALLIRDGAQSIAFAIDKIVSQQQVVVRPLSEQLDGLQGVRGCTILGDGEPGVILSLPELARNYFSTLGGRGGGLA